MLFGQRRLPRSGGRAAGTRSVAVDDTCLNVHDKQGSAHITLLLHFESNEAINSSVSFSATGSTKRKATRENRLWTFCVLRAALESLTLIARMSRAISDACLMCTRLTEDRVLPDEVEKILTSGAGCSSWYAAG